MNYHWRCRLYWHHGQYSCCTIETERNLHDIEVIRNFYERMTGHKMLIEGMQEHTYNILTVLEAFKMNLRVKA